MLLCVLFFPLHMHCPPLYLCICLCVLYLLVLCNQLQIRSNKLEILNLVENNKEIEKIFYSASESVGAAYGSNCFWPRVAPLTTRAAVLATPAVSNTILNLFTALVVAVAVSRNVFSVSRFDLSTKAASTLPERGGTEKKKG